MNHWFGRRRSVVLCIVAVLAVVAPAGPPASAQNPQLQQGVAEIRQLIAANRQSLSHYTWLQQQTILVKGEVKKVQLYQVHLGPDGKPQRVLTASSASPTPIGPLRRRIAENMSAEYEQYAQQIAALATSRRPKSRGGSASRKCMSPASSAKRLPTFASW